MHVGQYAVAARNQQLEREFWADVRGIAGANSRGVIGDSSLMCRLNTAIEERASRYQRTTGWPAPPLGQDDAGIGKDLPDAAKELLRTLQED